jgi:hypothetical protein
MVLRRYNLTRSRIVLLDHHDDTIVWQAKRAPLYDQYDQAESFGARQEVRHEHRACLSHIMVANAA